jgi:hypothetical protein
MSIVSIFYPSGEPVSQQSLRCSPGRLGRLAGVHYSFLGHCLHLCEWVGWVGLDSLIIHLNFGEEFCYINKPIRYKE